MSDQIQINREAVSELASLLRDADLTEIEYQEDSVRIRVVRERPQQVITNVAREQILQKEIQSAKSENMLDDLEEHPGVVKAPMVGTVYLSPGPEAQPFVRVGDSVTEGQTLFIIEAMKVMNMIKAPKAGILKHIFVKDAQPVEYDDSILIVE